MKKRSSKNILASIQEKKRKAEKGNFTFSLNKTNMLKFKEKCDKSGFSMASVLDELILSFIDD